METITIFPKDEKQKNLIKSILEEMRIQFELSAAKDSTLLGRDEYIAKIDKSIEEAEAGKKIKLPKGKQKEFLGL